MAMCSASLSLPFPFFGLCFWNHTPKTSLAVGAGEGCASPNPRAEDRANHENPDPVVLPLNEAFLLSKHAVPEAHTVPVSWLISSLLICSAVPGLEHFPEVHREWRMDAHSPSGEHQSTLCPPGMVRTSRWCLQGAALAEQAPCLQKQHYTYLKAGAT